MGRIVRKNRGPINKWRNKKKKGRDGEGRISWTSNEGQRRGGEVGGGGAESVIFPKPRFLMDSRRGLSRRPIAVKRSETENEVPTHATPRYLPGQSISLSREIIPGRR